MNRRDPHIRPIVLTAGAALVEIQVAQRDDTTAWIDQERSVIQVDSHPAAAGHLGVEVEDLLPRTPLLHAQPSEPCALFELTAKGHTVRPVENERVAVIDLDCVAEANQAGMRQCAVHRGGSTQACYRISDAAAVVERCCPGVLHEHRVSGRSHSEAQVARVLIVEGAEHPSPLLQEGQVVRLAKPHRDAVDNLDDHPPP